MQIVIPRQAHAQACRNAEMHIAMVEKIGVTLPGIAQLYSSACQEWLGPAEIARRFASVKVQCTKELLMVLQVPMYETLRRLNLLFRSGNRYGLGVSEWWSLWKSCSSYCVQVNGRLARQPLCLIEGCLGTSST